MESDRTAMTPESLIPLRTYATEDEAHDALSVLHAAGLTAYTSTQGHGRGGNVVQLVVAESDVDAAIVLLGEQAPGLGDDENEPMVCPRCRSVRSTLLPPYLLMGLVTAGAVAMALAYLERWWWLAGFSLASGLALQRSMRAPQWRCLNCRFTWNQRVENERQAEARRAAPE